MLYALLIIIAIGVLLMSNEGKSLLRFLVGTAIVAGILYIGFWIVLGSTALISSNWEQIKIILAIIFWAWFAIYYAFAIYKATKTKEQRIKIWQNFKKFFVDTWKQHPIVSVFLILSILFITYSAIFLY